MLLNLPSCFNAMSCAGSVVLTQTHPAAPYVCRTGSITFRCQYDTTDVVSWSVGDMSNVNISAIPGHTALPRTTTYQEVVVDSYTNLRGRYQCTVVAMSGIINSNNFMPPQPEGSQYCTHFCSDELFMVVIMILAYSCSSDHLQPDIGKQDSHYFEHHLVSRLP